MCNYGNQGIGFIGNSNSAIGGEGTDGSINVNVTSTRPCVLTIVNTGQQDLQVVVSGTQVGALAMSLAFPYTITQFANANTTYEIAKTDIVSYVYIGSTTQGQYSIATVQWNKKATQNAIFNCFATSLLLLNSLVMML